MAVAIARALAVVRVCPAALAVFLVLRARAVGQPVLIPSARLPLRGTANLATDSAWGLRVTIAAMIAMLLVHLMSLALIVPLGIHLLAIRRRALWNHRVSVAAILLIAFVAAWPCWRTGRSGDPATLGPSLSGLLFPLFGARLFSARGLEYFFGSGTVDGPLLSAAAAVSSIAHGLLWVESPSRRGGSDEPSGRAPGRHGRTSRRSCWGRLRARR